MRFWTLSPIISLFLMGQPQNALASGFVKSAGSAYTKIYTSVSPKVNKNPVLDSTENSHSESTWQLGLYSEVGLGLFPFKSQISLDVSLKSIKRFGANGENDTFESRGLTDTQISGAASLFEGEIAQVFGSPVYLSLAPKLGLMIPTTRKKFKQGNESQRHGDVPSGREFLVAAVDRGQWRLKPAAGLSISSNGVWASLLASQTQDVVPPESEHQWGADLGVSLPLNSWLQAGFAQTRKEQNIQHKWNSGLGVTFFEGVALEFSYERLIPKLNGMSSVQYIFGLSYRDI